MAANAFVRARIDEDLKNQAADVLAGMGLTISDLVRITLTKVAREKALPFDLREPGNDSNLLIVFYVQIMPDDFVMQLHRF
ncbi:type II toxin-antitoxin system RelB/DinJ family antitoxin [Escherichia coli]|uniref:type II toxin-antitoxin system RelB/DinJ family antitoxin n=1 Tax=Escherichia coli TaxID=562 RepID=UPI00210737DC|nr:type II toxin-antitoxin system RelB/DinJ family antitoxin [Escherichia coli]